MPDAGVGRKRPILGRRIRTPPNDGEEPSWCQQTLVRWKQRVGAAEPWRVRETVARANASPATRGHRSLPRHVECSFRALIPGVFTIPAGVGFGRRLHRLQAQTSTMVGGARIVGLDRPAIMRAADLKSQRILADGFECDPAMTVFIPAIRFGAEEGAPGGKPAGRLLTQRSAPKMRRIENIIMEQRLAMNFRSRLRVICATPVQKPSVWCRSKRFLCCVCKALR
jgi:hypothetical protein